MDIMDIVQTALTVLGSVMASSGLWAFIQKRTEKKDVKTRLLVGLAHERIISLCMKYIDKGWVSEDEYEDLMDLYVPYKDGGGNGSAERAINEVKKLKLISREQIRSEHN